MTITTEWRDATMEGVDVGVRIKKERPNIEEGTPIGGILAEMYDFIEILSILRALKDNSETAFNKAMDSFIQEELAETGEESDDE